MGSIENEGFFSPINIRGSWTKKTPSGRGRRSGVELDGKMAAPRQGAARFGTDGAG